MQEPYVAPQEERIEQSLRPAPQGKHPMEGEVTNLLSTFSEVSRRLRILEERYINIRRRTQVTDQNMITVSKNFSREFKTLVSDIDEIKRELEEITNSVKLIQKDLTSCATSFDLKVLQKYLSFWEPLNFVTEDDVKRMVKDALENRNI
jgi:hypothetical protein